MLAWLRVGSMVSTASRVTPGPFRSTINSEIERSSLLEPVRAATTAKSATSPSATGALAPVSAPFATEARIERGVTGPLPSTKAKVPIASPAASLGSQACFCASSPAISRNSVARNTDEEYGTGATTRPSSSAITQSSR